MCGITGVYHWNGSSSQRDVVAAMTARLEHRGPDDHGLFSQPGLALGHRRLSIIDLSERGRQPISNEDGTVWLTCNGEIYNYRTLRRQLEARGHSFGSDTDTEVLVHLYEESANDLVEFLEAVRGMFAFAIWDRLRQRLLLGRDRLGIKPLFYYCSDQLLAFASDLDALTACSAVPRRVDWTSLYEYLSLLTVPGPHTIFEDIRCLMPGSMIVVERGAVRDIRYWGLDPAPDELIVDAAEADEAIHAALAEAVELHLMADVEVGTFLSGGVDSGLVTALAAEQHARPARTYAATFPGEEVNEGPWAREAAERLGTIHAESVFTTGFLDGIEQVVRAMDQPLGLTSAASLFWLSRLAHQRIKVVLSGDGGDELFAGYARYRASPSRARIVDLAEFNTRKRCYLPPARALSLLSPELIPEVDTNRFLDRVRRLLSACEGMDELSRRLYVDLQTGLVDEMLAKLDRMTMAWGLEGRVPLLDHRVVELGMRVAGSIKHNGSQGKLPLRRLVTPHLGLAVGERTKHGFNSPLDGWLRTDLKTRTKLEALWPAVERTGVFDVAALRALKSELGTADGPTGHNIFSLLVFAIWTEQRGVRLT